MEWVDLLNANNVPSGAILGIKDALAGLGRAARLRGREDEAREHLVRALQLYPNHVPALLHLAMLAFDGGRPEAARKALARVAAAVAGEAR